MLVDQCCVEFAWTAERRLSGPMTSLNIFVRLCPRPLHAPRSHLAALLCHRR